MKKLIIYIPSYNRADRLMSQLKVINKEMTSDIKVVISDNNSTDIEGYKNIEKYCTDNNLRIFKCTLEKFFLIPILKLNILSVFNCKKQNICAQHAFAPSAKNIYSCLDS
jgi:glycosyltransferase involved in cell wall biosynthesis